MKYDYSNFGLVIKRYLVELSSTNKELAGFAKIDPGHLSKVIHRPELVASADRALNSLIDQITRGLASIQESRVALSEKEKEEFLSKIERELKTAAERDHRLTQDKESSQYLEITAEFLASKTGLPADRMRAILSASDGDGSKLVSGLSRLLQDGQKTSMKETGTDARVARV